MLANLIILALLVIGIIAGVLVYRRGWQEAKAELTAFLVAIGAAAAGLWQALSGQ